MPKSIKDLPPEIGKEISSHLPTIKDKTNSIVDRNTRTLFQPHTILSKFLEFVAQGKQEHAEKIFTIRKKNPQQLQELLLERGTVTDYSGRTFTHISAYEYAYWAKDKHMCRMLESHMDENTKAVMLKRCEAIEKNGLTFKQHGSRLRVQSILTLRHSKQHCKIILMVMIIGITPTIGRPWKLRG